MTSQYSSENRLKLLLVARESLGNYLDSGQHIEFSTESAELRQKRAVFVTLRNRETGDLRGCIGQSKPRYSLIEAVAKTAISSAVDDSRFPSVTIYELPDLFIEINVLSPLAPSKPENVEIGKHGVMLNIGDQGALFLPEVAVSNGWDRETFLDQLCRKADLPEGSWRDEEADLYVFESEAWDENEFLS